MFPPTYKSAAPLNFGSSDPPETGDPLVRLYSSSD
jgi:hypothetical protein